MGFQEWFVLFLIVLLIFGPSNLPKIGRALGKGIREFKDAVSGIGETIEREEADKKKQDSVVASAPAQPSDAKPESGASDQS
jgi:sec-independent protein translocase protein TatA